MNTETKLTSASLACLCCQAVNRTNQAPETKHESILKNQRWVCIKQDCKQHNIDNDYHKKTHIDNCDDAVKKGSHIDILFLKWNQNIKHCKNFECCPMLLFITEKKMFLGCFNTLSFMVIYWYIIYILKCVCSWIQLGHPSIRMVISPFPNFFLRNLTAKQDWLGILPCGRGYGYHEQLQLNGTSLIHKLGKMKNQYFSIRLGISKAIWRS